MKSITFFLTMFSFFIISCTPPPIIEKFESSWNNFEMRNWIGAEYWANRLQDWKIINGKLVCVNNKPLRTLHLLTRELSADSMGTLNMSVRLGIYKSSPNENEKSWAGFLIGAGNLENDYRSRSLIHNTSGKGGGIVAAINARGKLEFFDNENNLKDIVLRAAKEDVHPKVDEKGIELKVEVFREDKGYTMRLSTFNYETNEFLSSATIKHISHERLTGNIALIANNSTENPTNFWFDKWTVYGTKITKHDNRIFGPVMGVLYTLGNHGFILNAQIAPISKKELQYLRMFVSLKGKEQWKEIAEQRIDTGSYTVNFNFEKWDKRYDYDYKLTYKIVTDKGTIKEYDYHGEIKKEPDLNHQLKVLAVNNVINMYNSFDTDNFDFNKDILFPHNKIVEHIENQQADMLYFTGNQVDKNYPVAAEEFDSENLKLDYLYRWYMWHWTFGNVSKNTPTVLIMAERDYLQDRLWGFNATKGNRVPPKEYPYRYWRQKHYWANDYGGFQMPSQLINNVQKMQTGHLPASVDTLLSEAGIESYYTNFKYSNVGFAVIESQKFKTPPAKAIIELVPVNGFVLNTDVKVKKYKNKEAILLGRKQLKFLNDWAGDWNNESVKIVLSSKDFVKISSFTDSLFKEYEEPDLTGMRFDHKPKLEMRSKDMSYHGWPIEARDKTLRVIRKGFGFILTSGERTGSLTHLGIKSWGDAAVSFAVPPVYNTNPGRWQIKKLPKYHKTRNINDNFDGFGNKITVLAVTNPTHQFEDSYASGFGIITIDKVGQQIESDCKIIHNNELVSYPGWPIKTSIADNYGERKKFYLPEIRITRSNSPVIVKIKEDKSGKLVYAIYLKENTYQPRVNKKGKYHIIVYQPETGKKEEKHDVSASTVPSRIIEIAF